MEGAAGVGGGGGGGMMRSRRGRQERSNLGRSSPTGGWSRIGPIAKHKKVRGGVEGVWVCVGGGGRVWWEGVVGGVVLFVRWFGEVCFVGRM